MPLGKKYGGRKKGTPNKANQEIQEKLSELGCDPIEGMAIIASRAFEEGDLPLAGSMYKELAQYIAPKRKAVEVTGSNGGPVRSKWQVEFVNATPKG